MKLVSVTSLLICITFGYSVPIAQWEAAGRSTRTYGGSSISYSELNKKTKIVLLFFVFLLISKNFYFT